ncbi:MAG: ribosomal protein S19 family protein [Candidatus Hodgkinia cicadicola]
MKVGRPSFDGQTYTRARIRASLKHEIASDMIGHKLGEFVATRKQCSHNR